MKRKPVKVYVAGPYSADNVLDVLRNIGKGEYYASLLFAEGFAPFCPWHNKDYMVRLWDHHEITVDMFYKYSIAWLEVSDVMFLVPGWKKSKGTLEEIPFAQCRNIPIFTSMSELIKYRDRLEERLQEKNEGCVQNSVQDEEIASLPFSIGEQVRVDVINTNGRVVGVYFDEDSDNYIRYSIKPDGYDMAYWVSGDFVEKIQG